MAIACASLLAIHARVGLADDEEEQVEEEAAGEDGGEAGEEVEEEDDAGAEEAEADEKKEKKEKKAKKKAKKKGKKSEASLLVPVSEEGATVLIDGEEVGVTPIAPVTGMTVGKHQIEVVKDGYHDYMGFVEIPAEGTIRHDVMLKGGKRKKIKFPKFMKTWWFWTAVGVVVATGVGVGIGVGVQPEEPDAVHFPPY
jgi:hypothetical protein